MNKLNPIDRLTLRLIKAINLSNNPTQKQHLEVCLHYAKDIKNEAK